MFDVENVTVVGKSVRAVKARNLYDYINSDNTYSIYAVWFAEFNVDSLIIDKRNNYILETDAMDLLMMAKTTNGHKYRKYLIKKYPDFNPFHEGDK